jgi:histidinol-phosphate phosphatase family protein
MRPAVFLDRDGTIIEDTGYLSDPALVRPLPGAREGLDLLRAKGWPIVLVTNQSGVARGLFAVADYDRVAARVADLLGPFEAVCACFHLPPPDGRVAPWNVPCDCRKPAPGLLRRAARERELTFAGSFGVGDAWRDVAAFRAVGVRPFLVAACGPEGDPEIPAGGTPEDRAATTVIPDLSVFAELLPDRRDAEVVR